MKYEVSEHVVGTSEIPERDLKEIRKRSERKGTRGYKPYFKIEESETLKPEDKNVCRNENKTRRR